MKKYNEQTLFFAKELRKNMTDFEQKLWYYLRAKRFLGLKFKRQVPVGKYIVDFLCVDNKLIIELDGSQHLQQVEYDLERDRYLNSKGYKVIRIFDNEISNIEGVLDYIKNNVEELTPLSNSPPRGEGLNNIFLKGIIKFSNLFVGEVFTPPFF